jgi:regulatory protein
VTTEQPVRRSRRRPKGDELESGASGGDPLEQARQLCLRLLDTQPRTKAQLAAAMKRGGASAEVSAAILARLTDVGLVDDAAFARAWVESRHHAKGLARRALAAELRRRGVENENIAQAMSELDPDEEAATARRLVDRALPATRGKPLPTRVRRLVGMLARKGYSPSLAYRVVREAIAQDEPGDADLGEDLDDVALAMSDSEEPSV